MEGAGWLPEHVEPLSLPRLKLTIDAINLLT